MSATTIGQDTGRRLAFFGSPDFAVPALRALHATGRPIVAVYCQKPRPAGRGQAVTRCPVHVEAARLGLSVRHPERLRDEADAFAALGLHTAVVAAYGLILPRAMLAAPVNGCLNIHASLLPRWRGASPIQAALLAGDEVTGVTIMRMEAGLDTGPMLAVGRVPIHTRMTAPELHDALAALGAALIVPALDDPSPGVPQPEAGVTYAAKLAREDGRIDWTRDAAAIDRQIRALNPWPGTYTTLDGVTLKVLAGEPVAGSGAPGIALDDQLTIAAGVGAIRLTRVQAPGRAALPTADFLRGRPVPAGTRLGEAAS